MTTYLAHPNLQLLRQALDQLNNAVDLLDTARQARTFAKIASELIAQNQLEIKSLRELVVEVMRRQDRQDARLGILEVVNSPNL